MATGSLLAIALIGLGPLGTWLLLPLEDRFPPWRDDGRPVSGVIVLGGAIHPRVSFARGQLSLNAAAERMVVMAALARRFPTGRIVFSGGSGSPRPGSITDARTVARLGGVLGLDPARVIYEDRSRNTYENAVDTRALVTPQPGERWLLVTSAWHMPRAVGCFRRAGFAVTADPVDYRTRGPGLAPHWPISVADGFELVDLAAKEWVGLLAYRLTGRTSALFPSPSSDGTSATAIR